MGSDSPFVSDRGVCVCVCESSRSERGHRNENKVVESDPRH